MAVGVSGILDLIQGLPQGYYIIGDNVYPPGKKLLPVFGGADCLNKDNENANFYMSSCRIIIECAFGGMVQKWAILQAPLRINLDKCGTLFECIARLHNFCIDERLGEDIWDGEGEFQHPQNWRPEEPRDTTGTSIFEGIPGILMTRTYLVQHLKQPGLVCLNHCRK